MPLLPFTHISTAKFCSSGLGHILPDLRISQWWILPRCAESQSMAMWPWYRLRSASPWKSKPFLPSKQFSTSGHEAHCMLGYSMAGMVAVEQYLWFTLTLGTERKPFFWMHLCISLTFLISSEVHGGETFCSVKKTSVLCAPTNSSLVHFSLSVFG